MPPVEIAYQSYTLGGKFFPVNHSFQKRVLWQNATLNWNNAP